MVTAGLVVLLSCLVLVAASATSLMPVLVGGTAVPSIDFSDFALVSPHDIKGALKVAWDLPVYHKYLCR